MKAYQTDLWLYHEGLQNLPLAVPWRPTKLTSDHEDLPNWPLAVPWTPKKLTSGCTMKVYQMASGCSRRHTKLASDHEGLPNWPLCVSTVQGLCMYIVHCTMQAWIVYMYHASLFLYQLTFSDPNNGKHTSIRIIYIGFCLYHAALYLYHPRPKAFCTNLYMNYFFKLYYS